ncbi:THAP domain-containing protein 10 [Nymphon striatum]|nr:THAP domain-containing protein 10 [Nymphon striatum]
MPTRCVAFGCSNLPSETLSVHRFPKSVPLRALWTKQVQRTRANWAGPTPASGLCSEHFEENCFEAQPSLMQKFGLPVYFKKVLKKGMVPTIFKRGKSQIDIQSQSATYGISSSVSATPRPELLSKEKRTRVVEKLAQKRVIAETLMAPPAAQQAEAEVEDLDMDMDIDEPIGTSSVEMGTQTDLLRGQRRSVRVQVSIRPSRRTIGTQTHAIKISSAESQTEKNHSCSACDHHEELSQHQRLSSSSDSDAIDSADDYVPSEDGSITSSSSSEPISDSTLESEYFLVSWTSLLTLFHLMCCCHCGGKDLLRKEMTVGTNLHIVWTIRSLWEDKKTWLLASLQAEQRDLVLGGDGRSDSPGHSAKFGSYTMIELEANVIIDTQLVQSNEVGGANYMEKEGFIRSINFIEHYGLNIGTIVSDRHVQLRKWIRENRPDITHLFDIWHISKSLKRKLLALSKEKGCEDLAKWINSIINHLYWSVISTPLNQPDVINAKTLLAVLHFNENAGKSQKIASESGQSMYALSFPKWKKGGYTLRKRLQNSTYGYVEDIISDVLERVQKSVKEPCSDEPPNLSSSVLRPDKQTAIDLFCSRYFTTPDEAGDA